MAIVQVRLISGKDIMQHQIMPAIKALRNFGHLFDVETDYMSVTSRGSLRGICNRRAISEVINSRKSFVLGNFSRRHVLIDRLSDRLFWKGVFGVVISNQKLSKTNRERTQKPCPITSFSEYKRGGFISLPNIDLLSLEANQLVRVNLLANLSMNVFGGLFKEGTCNKVNCLMSQKLDCDLTARLDFCKECKKEIMADIQEIHVLASTIF